ncbi:MAG: hypothetical protein ACSLFH_14540 [Desulfuromonadales bacterium]
MNAHIVFGLFALYVAAISLYQVLVGQQDALLSLLRRFWGRALGHSLYFVARVALPMLICVFCLGWGVRHYDPKVTLQDFDAPLQLNIEYYRGLESTLPSDKVEDPIGVVHGA